MPLRKLTKEEIRKSAEDYFSNPENKESVERLEKSFAALSDKMDREEEFLKAGGEIFPAGNPRKYSELNEFEKDEVVGYLSMMTAPTSGIFVGDTPEERFGIELLDEVALDMSK